MYSMASSPTPSILGISFDGLAISGIVNEFLNAAAVLRKDRFRVLLDLGFDITAGKTRNLGQTHLPSWVRPVRCIEDMCRGKYRPELIRHVRELVIAGTSVRQAGVYDDTVQELASSLVATFALENVHLLLIENGTLPENPLFTEALLLAIAAHGIINILGSTCYGETTT